MQHLTTKLAILATTAILSVQPLFAQEYYDYNAGAAPAALGVWHGLYAGAHVGLTSGSYETTLATPASSFEIDAAHIAGGLFAGYNWQQNKIVFGAEADFTITALDDNATIASKVYAGSTDWKASLRGRLGYAANAILFYGTMGVSFADLELSAQGVNDDAAVMGWTIGAGSEVKLTDKIFARGEYLYADHGEEDFTLSNITTKSDFSDHTFRLGVGYKY